MTAASQSSASHGGTRRASASEPTAEEIAVLYERYSGPIFHRARSILHSDEAAQDAVQETFARVIRNWDAFRGESSPYTWMYRITTNWCLNQIRNRKGRHQKHVDHRQDILGDEVTWQKPTTEAALVRKLLADCDEQTRAIVIHLYFDDMSKEATAKLVGLSVPTVRKRLRVFLERARRQLDAEPPPRSASLAAARLGVLLSLSALAEASPWGLS